MTAVQSQWVEPPDNIGLSNHTVTGDTTIPVWEWGTTHLLEWTTSWEYFDLYLVQDNPPNYEDVILTDATNITSFNWTVATDVIDLNISRICWFKLHQTADEGDVFLESAAFNISGGPSWPSSVPATITATPIPTLISTATTTATATPTLASNMATSIASTLTLSSLITNPTDLPSSDPSTTASHNSSQLALEIALGISIPLMLAFGLLTGWKIRNKRRARLSRKAADSFTVDTATMDGNYNVAEKEAVQVHEMFSPTWCSELHDGARWEMPV